MSGGCGRKYKQAVEGENVGSRYGVDSELMNGTASRSGPGPWPHTTDLYWL